ncbi:hypothetical protein RMN57_01765 [Kitasatospora sp. CM 4170]|uniref:Transposase n=1 Tax=Kitasatospora aburaviensis TaxID=67265 RepID=A0ABW1F1J9_9ACTN|nr:hypothetical protein [Kitasatospora sp. CM 4170]WNM43515.1 hypothetical protein RMN57_01765 [Kitasatospora sp. CM 4170]
MYRTARRKATGRNRLRELGDRLEVAKRTATREPLEVASASA